MQKTIRLRWSHVKHWVGKTDYKVHRAILASMMKRSVFDRSSKHPEIFCQFMLDDLRMGSALDSSR